MATNMIFGVNLIPNNDVNNSYALGDSQRRWKLYVDEINGELCVNGKIPLALLPDASKSVIEANSLSDFPATGESEKIYIAKDTDKAYYWDGTAYVEISSALALGETSTTAYRGDRGKVAYDHATETRLITATASGLYKVAATKEGHVASLTAVEKADITALGIPGSDTTYSAGDGLTLSGTTFKVNLSSETVVPAISRRYPVSLYNDELVVKVPHVVTDIEPDQGLRIATETVDGAGNRISQKLAVDLKSSTKLSIVSAAAAETAGRVYPVALDSNGDLAVCVPWTDTHQSLADYVKSEVKQLDGTGKVKISGYSNIVVLHISRSAATNRIGTLYFDYWLARVGINGDVTADVIVIQKAAASNDIYIENKTGGALMLLAENAKIEDYTGTVTDNVTRYFLGDERYVNKIGDTMTGQLYVNVTGDKTAATGDDGAIVIGDKTGENISIDGNEIHARNNKTASILNLNADGGTVRMFDATAGQLLVYGLINNYNNQIYNTNTTLDITESGSHTGNGMFWRDKNGVVFGYARAMRWTLAPYTDYSGLRLGARYYVNSQIKECNLELLINKSGVPAIVASSPVHINRTDDITAANAGGALVIGNLEGANLGIDNNEIQARNVTNGTSTGATLSINLEGGNVSLGNTSSVITLNGLTKMVTGNNAPRIENDSNLALVFATKTNESYRGAVSCLLANNTGQMSFINYKNGSSVYERYKLPTSDEITESASYEILTNKHTVTIGQGGTGAQNASNAQKNIIGTTPYITDIGIRDLNDFFVGGLWQCAGNTANAPITNPCFILQFGHDTDRWTQIAWRSTDTTTKTIYMRKYYSSAWGTWTQITPPAVTTSDNGKFMRVSNGAWVAETVASASGVSF